MFVNNLLHIFFFQDLIMTNELLKTEMSEANFKIADIERLKSDVELRLSESEELRFSSNALWFGKHL